MKISPILISIMIISVVILCGCNEKSVSLSNEEKRLLGTWSGSQPLWIMAYFSDKTCSYFSDLSAVWEINKGKLIVTDKDGEYTFAYNFANNDTLLTITDEEVGGSWEFRKQ